MFVLSSTIQIVRFKSVIVNTDVTFILLGIGGYRVGSDNKISLIAFLFFVYSSVDVVAKDVGYMYSWLSVEKSIGCVHGRSSQYSIFTTIPTSDEE